MIPKIFPLGAAIACMAGVFFAWSITHIPIVIENFYDTLTVENSLCSFTTIWQWLVEYCCSLPSAAQPGYSYHPPWAHTAGTYTIYSVHKYVHVGPCMYKQTPLALYCLLGRLW